MASVVGRRYVVYDGRKKREDLWTPEATTRLRELHASGISGSQIAGELARDGHGSFTRNAVIGKVHRLGLVSTKKINVSGKHNGAMKNLPKTSPRPPRAPGSLEQVVPIKQRALDDFNAKRRMADKGKSVPSVHDKTPSTSVLMSTTATECCKWPTNDDPTHFEVCGQPVTRGAYCAPHAAKAYNPSPKNGRAANYEARQSKFFSEQMEYKNGR